MHSPSLSDAAMMTSQFTSDCGQCIGVSKSQCTGETNLLVKVRAWADEERMPRVHAATGYIYVDKIVPIQCKDMYIWDSDGD